MIIDAKTVVTIHYRLHNSAGEKIEESFGGAPMEYLHGAQNLIPGLEAQLQGKKAGDTFTADIAEEDAYGAIEPGLVQEVPLSAFEGVDDIIPGTRFMAQTEQGPRPVVVTEVKDDTVIVDGNHPMAGQALSFYVEVADVRAATEDEVAHGHPHQEGGCCGGGGCGSHDHDHSHDDDHECCGGSGDCAKGDDCCGGHGHH
ncbi:FKBP-type peptidyl-prolyl cis-trans isomerase [Ferrimonas lipolytica]|uniref:Peptidyl-prolyl cis-trans isomerase n=1 Tax=Ferrimonas lipolytica TaxID=2724191 RepID=A0A6H1UET4_9GAMM|nr:peptidylprolyl isomerase [Ferrimonas lipolytica]QIZ77554.1 peptidylprolyl isomerase [Ferrimonas lipolytica]